MLFGDATPIIQVDWQGLAVLGSTIGGSIVGAAKILANQWKENNRSISEGIAQRHDENRADSKEYRDENRQLSHVIIDIQAKTVEGLISLQGEIKNVVALMNKIHCNGAGQS